MKKDKFWINKKLTELSHSEWEALCDNCGKCCVIKLQNEKHVLFIRDIIIYNEVKETYRKTIEMYAQNLILINGNNSWN